MYTLQEFFTAAGLINPVPFAQFITMEKAPWASQVRNLNRLLTNERWGLYGQPATGKTMAAQAAALYWISEGNKVVCVMPPTLRYQFKEEFFSTFKGADRYVKFHIFEEGPAARRELKKQWSEFRQWPEIIAMSYQLFAVEYQDLIKAGYCVLICDEAQALKDSSSKIFSQVEEFINQPGGAAFIPMTGTPIHNEIIDAYALTKLTNPEAYRSLKHFDNLHSVYKKIHLKTPKKTKSGKRLSSFKVRATYVRHDLLRENMYRFASRDLKKDVLEIKDPSIIEMPVRLEKEHLDLYKKLVRERILVKGEELIIAANAQALRQKALQMVTCPELFVEEATFKNNVVEAVREIINGMDIKKDKVVVFANYQDSVRTLEKYFKEYNPALMYGDSNSEKNRQKFLNDDTCRLLIAHPKSAGYGLNLQHICHTIIFAEPTGVPGDFQQCMDRVLRYGQKNLVNVYIVKALGTIAPKATVEMLRKEGQARLVNQDWHSFADEFIPAAA